MSIILNGTTGITSPNIDSQVGDNTPAAGDFTDVTVSGTLTTGGGALSPQTGFKNRIINGSMTIDQRNAGAAVTANGAFPVDRFFVGNTTDGAFSGQKNTSVPAGFVNSLKITTTTADASLTTTQRISVVQSIEGNNVADLNWGTANAQAVTLSFWVRSSLTGIFGGSLQNSGAARSYPFSYTISVADTWEQKSVTIAGDTSGTWLTTNGIGLNVVFCLGAGPDRTGTAGAWTAANIQSVTGAVSVIGTINATWYVTGVQLEVGSTATPFEFRSIGQELALCQRYYWKTTPTTAGRIGMAASSATNSTGRAVIPFPVTMRTSPAALEQSGTAGDYSIFFLTTATACTAVPTFSTGTPQSSEIGWTASSGHTAGNAGTFYSTATAGFLAWSAEL